MRACGYNANVGFHECSGPHLRTEVRGTHNPMDVATQLRFLKGAGPARAARLAKLGIETLGDLLEHYPRAYLDRTHLTPLARLVPGGEATSVGVVRSVSLRRTRGGMRNVHAILEDESGLVECVWFNQPYLERVLKRGRRILVSGPVELFRRLQFKNPEFEILEPEGTANGRHTGGQECTDQPVEALEQSGDAAAPGIVPVYPLTAGVSQKVMRKLVGSALDALMPLLHEFMPASILSRRILIPWADAHREIHNPSSRENMETARRRIAFQELFDLQLLLAISRRMHKRPQTAPPLRCEGNLVQHLLEDLPFELTAAQRRVIEQIRQDISRDCPMHRLLEGDVGSGKTLVALAGALLAVEAGFQVALMAPTEILVSQHGRTFERLCEPLGVRVATFTGGLPASRARELRSALEDGSIAIALGTHALIQESIAFHRLGLVIVDEQHRFGVTQRARLQGKGRTPHTLVMSATPIPRTLALTLFGDLDLSVLDEKPPGFISPKTHLVPEERYEEMLSYISGELAGGAQVYFVCPLIEASEALDLRAATDLYARLIAHAALRQHRGALLHGRMKQEEKDQVMNAFVAGEVGFLVSTTVIEVGVDVANASLMVIEHPERFGLSQLHQLRGRVGRGRQPAHLFLVGRSGIGEEAMRRIEILMRESDGFRIAEEDLRQRGPGDFFGVRQSGLPPLKLANPIADPQLLEEAREEAFHLVDDLDRSELVGTALWRRLEARFGERIALYEVG